MSSEVRKNIVHGLKWNTIGQISRQVISFGLMIVLTRILAPTEFGMIGILLFFTGFADVFITAGLNAALIQKNSTSDREYSTVFLFNIGVSVVLYFVIYFGAPFIASYFNEPELLPLSRIIALVFIINAFGTIQSTILTINLNFRKQNMISVAGISVSAIVALYMAYNGYGVYSLVGQYLAMSITSNLILWITSAWKPRLYFSTTAFRSLFGFGSSILASSILDRLFTTVDNLIVGRVFNLDNLGLYTRAKSTRDLPVLNSVGVLSSVYFPVLSKIKDDEVELRRYHLRFLGLITYVILPLMVGLLVVAKPLTLFLFTKTWIASVPMLQIFAIYGALYPLSVILVQTLLVKGKSRRFLYLDIAKKVILLLGMIIGGSLGMIPFLVAVCIANYVGFLLNLLVLSKTLNIQIIEYLKCFAPSFFISLLMALFVFLLGMVDFPSTGVQILSQLALGAVSYIALSLIFKLSEFQFLKDLILKKRK